MAMPWIRPAVRETVTVCENDRPNVIWATIGPVSAGVVAYRASLRTGIPYVLDFRDPWGLNYCESDLRGPSWVKSMKQGFLWRILKEARAVIFLYEAMAQSYFHAFQDALDARRIHIISNGYDGEIEQFMHPPGEKCRILYAGTLSTYRYDTLLQALCVFKTANYELAEKLQVLFVGEGVEDLKTRVANLGISDMVKTAPPTSYAEINQLQREAHALLVLGRSATMKGYELYAGAKLFGYLKAGRPIVGVLPPDETRKILDEVGVSTVADAESISDILTVLEKVVSAWSNGTLGSLVPNRATCEVYSASRQTSALIRALEGTPAARPLVPKLTKVPLSLRA
jgi:glycosyltransferase involved in cell wall biosynthesis